MEAVCSNTQTPGFECFGDFCDFMVSCKDYQMLLNPGSMQKENLATMCIDGCFTKMFDSIAYMSSCLTEKFPGIDMSAFQFPGFGGSSQEASNAMCSQNPFNDEYCYLVLQQISEAYPALEVGDPTFLSNFTALQKQGFCAMVSQAGCCPATLLKFTPGSQGIDEAAISSTCGWTKLPKPCGGYGETRKSVEVDIKSDILWSDWSSMSESQKQIAQYSATQDLKSTLNLEFSPLAFTKGADGKVVLHFVIDSTDDPQLEANVLTALGSNTLDWSNLAASIPGVDAVVASNPDVKEEEVTRMLPDSSSYRKMPGFFVLSSVLFVRTFF